MKLTIGKLATAAALTGFLGLGGVSLAGAQEVPSTTTPPTTQETPAPTTPPGDDAPLDREECEHKAGSGAGEAPDSGDTDLGTL